MSKTMITEDEMNWETPVHGVMYRIAYLQPPAQHVMDIAMGEPVYLKLPVYTEVAADGSGNFSKALSKAAFLPSDYWDIDQLIEVYAYNGSSWVKLSYGDGSTDGTWTFNESTNTVSGVLAAAASQTVRIYYVPHKAPVRIEVEFQTPRGKVRKTIYSGIMGQFVHTNLKRERVRFEGSASLVRSDKLEIKVKAPGDDHFEPFKPGSTTDIVDIVDVSFYANISAIL